jgi:hypothetical protein
VVAWRKYVSRWRANFRRSSRFGYAGGKKFFTPEVNSKMPSKQKVKRAFEFLVFNVLKLRGSVRKLGVVVPGFP